MVSNKLLNLLLKLDIKFAYSDTISKIFAQKRYRSPFMNILAEIGINFH